MSDLTIFLLLPGAGGVALFWHCVEPLLQAAGHETIAVDLPGDDSGVDLCGYVDLAVAAAGDAEPLVVVAQSMGAFTAAPVAESLRPARLVLLNAMVPLPGETADGWWAATGSQAFRIAAARSGGYAEDFDLETYFLHDLPPEERASMNRLDRDEVAPPSSSRARSRRTPTSRSRSSPAVATGSSRSPSSSASRVSGRGSTSWRSRVGTSAR